jgi:hypothetical protein
MIAAEERVQAAAADAAIAAAEAELASAQSAYSAKAEHTAQHGPGLPVRAAPAGLPSTLAGSRALAFQPNK